jgi:hypothetical protein
VGYEHNLMAHVCSEALLREVRSGGAAWCHARLTPLTTLWQGMAEWPRPDIAFEDRSTDGSIALEFKPPNQSKREYVTGLGQAITYLQAFEFSGLVVPRVAADGFKIAEFLADVFGGLLNTLPVALFAYDKTPSKLTAIRPLQDRATPPGIPKGVGRDVFWGYWRDLSSYDVLSLLRVVSGRTRGNFSSAFMAYWKKYSVTGSARTWEGRRRKKKALSAPSLKSERLNADLSLRHSGLLSSDGRLTDDGHSLLRVGMVYGADSTAFLDQLARQILTCGQHLELILWVEKEQRLLSKAARSTSKKYFAALDGALAKRGVIPRRVTTSAKASYVRDEPKLWKKLGLLSLSTATRYFHPGTGLVFNWRQIVALVDSMK